MALKKKELSGGGGASLLPRLMTEASAPGAGPVRLLIRSLVPASAEWNFYSPLPGDKMVELLESIQHNGLLHPIVVWRAPGQPDMVLSGHNRLEAYKKLYEKTGDEEYARIPCTVLEDLTEEQAREIIVDSNWVQRSLSPSEKARSICQKYALAGRKARSANGSEHLSTYEIIAQQYGLSGRQIARYIKLGSLCPALLRLLDEGKLGVAAGVKLAGMPDDLQADAARLIAENGLTGAQTKALSPSLSRAQLEQLFAPAQEEPEPEEEVRVRVPSRWKEEFLRMAARWLEEKEAQA